jgi:hypothetical protein
MLTPSQPRSLVEIRYGRGNRFIEPLVPGSLMLTVASLAAFLAFGTAEYYVGGVRGEVAPRRLRAG